MLRKKYKPETFVFFVDNDDSYIRDVLAKFEEVNEHNIKIFSRSKEFFEEFQYIEINRRKIYIIFLSTSLELDSDNKEVNPIDVLKRIKEINSQAEVVLYSDEDNIDLVSLAFNQGAYTFMKKNENIILRIENNIKGIISQKMFLLKKFSSKITTLVFLAFLTISMFGILILYFVRPELFVF